jgi:PhnB protein
MSDVGRKARDAHPFAGFLRENQVSTGRKTTESGNLLANGRALFIRLNSGQVRPLQQRRPLMAVKPIPKGYHSVTPYLIVKGAAKAIDFYKKAFAATEIMRFPGPNGTIAHAEIKIGDSPVMLADEGQASGYRAPDAYGGSPVSLMIYIENVDKVFDQAVSNGAKSTRPVEDQFYGDRLGTIVDPFGHTWNLATHVEDVSMEEMQRRMAALPKSA